MNIPSHIRLAACTLTSLACLGGLHAAVVPNALFSDNAVLQQDVPIPVWGTANAGEKVKVEFDGQAVSTVAVDGHWLVRLPAHAAGGPFALTLTGENNVVINNVLVGEVWLCSGQSNMAFTLAQANTAKADIPLATDAQMRFFRVTSQNKLEPQTTVQGKWEICSPQDIGAFSAVGYYFGRELRRNLERPVGLIGSSWGGTPAQAWTSLSGLQKEPSLSGYVQAHAKVAAGAAVREQAYPKQLADYQAQLAAWNAEVKPAFDAATQAWNAAVKQALAAATSPPPRPQPSRPRPNAPGNPDGNPSVPSSLFNGLIAPLIPYAIKGVIWYQGESNAVSAPEYDVLFQRLIVDWREHWAEGDFPFLFVELANYQGALTKPENGHFARLREAQVKALALPKTAMASATDIGNPADIHPKDKLDVGRRLALAARRVAYGQNVPAAGPLYAALEVKGAEAHVAFKDADGGLVLAAPPWRPDGQVPPVPSEISDLEIAGADHVWHPAKGRIDGPGLVVVSPEVPAPLAVRYGWSDAPVLTLYNKAGLPASPFRTDDWDK